MIIKSAFENDWHGKGHVWGECMADPHSDLMYVYIPKNATSWTKPNLRDWRWEFYNYKTDNLNKHAVIALRDPVERWNSGIAEYFACYYPHFKFNDIETIEMIFERVTFDDHTDRQINFIDGLDTDNCTFLYCDDAYSRNFGAFIKDHYGPNRYENYTRQHVSNDDPIRKRFKEIFAYYLKDPKYLKKVKDHFKVDYELIEQVTFFDNIHQLPPLEKGIATTKKLYPSWNIESLRSNNTLPVPNEAVCEVPKYIVSVNPDGQCFLCSCEIWLPLTVGHINEFNSLEEMWNSPIAIAIQEDVANKKYSHCAVSRCGILTNNINGILGWEDGKISAYQIGINIDNSCNLACPSCRKEIVNYTSGPVFEEKQKAIYHLLDLLEKFDKPCVIRTSGGDALASTILRPLFTKTKLKDNQSFYLQTNGLLMQKVLPGSKMLESLAEISISVDAGSKEVYENVRRPGKFSILEENLQWLVDHRSLFRPDFRANLTFTIQKENALDVLNFAALCKKYNLRGNIQGLEDWGTWSNFKDQDVINNKDNPLHLKTIELLKEVSKDPNILLVPIVKQLIDNT